MIIRTKKEIQTAEKEIHLLQKQIDYDTRDYPIEYLVSKFDKGDFFKPDYQRNEVWDHHRQERFIESLILGYPIPLLFLSDTKDGKLEIVDGYQRITSLRNFLNGSLILDKMDKLKSLKSFNYDSLPEAEQLRLSGKPLRVIVLKSTTDKETRIDLFNRINTSPLQANDSEIRSGSEILNPLMRFIQKLAEKRFFLDLIQLSETKLARKENSELVSRFFAYSHNYQNFQHDVGKFVDAYIKEYGNESFTETRKDEYTHEFNTTMKFIENNFPKGVFKNRMNQTPRVRFEAITVGTNLALKSNPNLNVSLEYIEKMLKSADFKRLTTSDGSNSRRRVVSRINFVKDWLLIGN